MCSLTAVPYPAETVAPSTLTPQSANRTPSPSLRGRSLYRYFSELLDQHHVASWCSQPLTTAAGAGGYRWAGSRGCLGCSPISVPGPEEDFLKASSPAQCCSWHLSQGYGTGPGEAASDGTGTSTSCVLSPSQDAFCRRAVACFVKAVWESGIKKRGCAKRNGKLAAGGEKRAQQVLVSYPWSCRYWPELPGMLRNMACSLGLLSVASEMRFTLVAIQVDIDSYFLNK